MNYIYYIRIYCYVSMIELDIKKKKKVNKQDCMIF